MNAVENPQHHIMLLNLKVKSSATKIIYALLHVKVILNDVSTYLFETIYWLAMWST